MISEMMMRHNEIPTTPWWVFAIIIGLMVFVVVKL